VTGATLQAIPGGNHPALQHVPPPSTANGSGVVHELPAGGGDDGGGGGGGGIGGETGATLHTMPGGSHPPLQHVPPPSTPNGSGAVQAPTDGGGGRGGGGGETGATLQAIPGGSHPPSQHVPPPSTAKGSAPTHEAPAAGAAGTMR
jgi:hypothetical protein